MSLRINFNLNHYIDHSGQSNYITIVSCSQVLSISFYFYMIIFNSFKNQNEIICLYVYNNGINIIAKKKGDKNGF